MMNVISRPIWLLITRKCSFECRHCYFCGSRKGETLTLPQVKRTIQHLPSGIKTLGISGGEPFTNKKLLYETLRIVKKRKFSNLTEIIVQTIGFWAKNRAYTKKVVGKLINLGVNSFYIFGHDNWHSEHGLKKERQEVLVDVLRKEFDACEPKEIRDIKTKSGNKITYILRGTELVLPIGRAAWATTSEEWSQQSTDLMCKCRDFLSLNPAGVNTGAPYTINFNGEVHYCIYLTTKPLGNIIERPLVDILRNARRNKFFQIMNKGNVVDFAMEYFGMSKQEATRLIEKKGRCIFHIELLTQYFKNRRDAPIMYDVFRRERERYKIPSEKK